jgi:hypothetical protein
LVLGFSLPQSGLLNLDLFVQQRQFIVATNQLSACNVKQKEQKEERRKKKEERRKKKEERRKKKDER